MTDDSRPTFSELLDWIEGRLPDERATAIEALVRSGDRSTARTVSWIEGFIDFGRRNPIADPPPIVRQRLHQAFQHHLGQARPVQHLVAELSFDSRADNVLVGVRGAGDQEATYQLAFSAEEADVLIDVSPLSVERVRLDGQVLASGTSATAWSAEARYQDGRVRSVEGDRQGCFQLANVPRSAQKLLLSNGELEINVHLPDHWAG